MEIRWAKSKDELEVSAMISYCFPKISEERFKRLWEEKLILQQLLVATKDDEVLGCVAVYPYQMRLRGAWVAMGGVGLVATRPEHRHAHVASGLLEHALTYMKEAGMGISLLGPFSAAYYRRYGWEIAFTMLEYDVPVHALRGCGVGDVIFRKLGAGDYKAMELLYESCTSSYNGVVHPEDRCWTSLQGDDLHTYGVYRQDGGHVLLGYVSYRLQDRSFEIVEMLYASPCIQLEILYFIYKHRAQVDRVYWSWAPPDDELSLLLHDYGDFNGRLIMGKMARIVDIRLVIQKLSYDRKINEVLVVRVEDALLPWHGEALCVRVADGKATVDESDIRNHPVVTCSIGVLTQIILGFVGARQATGMNKLFSSSEAALDTMEKLFPKQTTYNQERF